MLTVLIMGTSREESNTMIEDYSMQFYNEKSKSEMASINVLICEYCFDILGDIHI